MFFLVQSPVCCFLTLLLSPSPLWPLHLHSTYSSVLSRIMCVHLSPSTTWLLLSL